MVSSDGMHKPIEVLFWSIAFPGFGQFLNGKFFKGITFLILEFLINNQSHLNTIIVSSFHGEIESAIELTNYQWLMFYPCVYLFVMWDAYRDAGGGKEPFAFLPFVISAYLGTIGVVFSNHFQIFRTTWGPIWLSILFLLIGVGIGFILKRVLVSNR
jgi:hypothetical protein